MHVMTHITSAHSAYCHLQGNRLLSDLCFAGNVDSFPFRQISGALYVHFLAKVMPKFSVNFGMTCARKLDISSA